MDEKTFATDRIREIIPQLDDAAVTAANAVKGGEVGFAVIVVAPDGTGTVISGMSYAEFIHDLKKVVGYVEPAEESTLA